VTATVTPRVPGAEWRRGCHAGKQCPAAASVPASVSIMKAKTTKTFTVTTANVASATTVTISATYNGTTAMAQLTVNPPPPAVLSGLAVNPKGVVGAIHRMRR
jgi:hypothetical protein